ncbi:MAG: cytochrome b N-terminal domain-containing protein [Bryobacteraceae bacterium]|nr:cytochrome b N-terminal domain-containing protein [Bryobacteraceae bacterium]
MKLLRDIWRSYRRRDSVATTKGKLQLVVHSLWLHIHPAKVHRSHFRLTYTWYLGFVSFYLFLILVATGVALMFYYRPTTAFAYQDMKDLEFAVFLGKFTRNMHRWGAHAMIIVVVLHMYRVYFTGSYKKPRQLNWVIGVALLLLTLLLSFTGYLLPWDQLAFWAITVGTAIGAYTPWLGPKGREILLGGHTVGDAALIRFYVLHCVALPTLTTLLIMLHFWRIRKDGGLSPPPSNLREFESPAPGTRPVAVAIPVAPHPGGTATSASARAVAVALEEVSEARAPRYAEDKDIAFSYPFAFYREGIAFLITFALMIVAAMYWNAPLEELANPAKTPNPSKAPWYFLGVQELVSYSALIGGVVAPALMVIALLVIPYLDTRDVRAPSKRKWGIWIFTLVTLANVVFIVIGTFFRGEGWKLVWPWASP